jgi:hypothetical protein
MEMADELLLEAKRAGRNRVLVRQLSGPVTPVEDQRKS